MQKLNKTDIDLIMSKCTSLARRKPPEFFNFRKMKNNRGEYLYYPNEKIDPYIDLDPRRSVLSTGIHECLHHLYPKWCETQIRYAESRIINRAESFDLAKFLKHLSLKIYESEKSEARAKSRTQKPVKSLKTKKIKKPKK